MKISILVPVFNEEQTISQVITELLAVKLHCTKEIVIVDDGSTDKTSWYLDRLKKKNKSDIKIIHHKFNQGKGSAVQSGIRETTGDYLLIQDADLEYNPIEITKLLRPLLKASKTKLIAVYGSRFKTGKPIISPLYFLGNKFLTFLTNLLYGTSLTDMETGYKLLPMTFMKSVKLHSTGFDIEPEITVKLLKVNIPIFEVPITYKGRSHLAGKKLTIKDAFAAMKTLVSLKYA